MQCNSENLREYQYEILCYIDTVCKNNNIRYYLAYGTCLGAVRHQGFIPWDDDIDIVMPRDDYTKFEKIMKQSIDDKFFYQDRMTDKEYPFCFAKIRYNGTLFLQKALKNLNINHGIFVDVFPLDGVPNKPKQQKRFVKKNRFYNYIVLTHFLKRSNYYIFSKLVTFIFNCLYYLFGADRLRNKLDRLAQKYPIENSEYVCNFYSAWGMKEILNKGIVIGKEQKLFFYRDYFNVPFDYKAYLSHIYGDYMRLPPVEKRISDHETIDIQIPTLKVE